MLLVLLSPSLLLLLVVCLNASNAGPSIPNAVPASMAASNIRSIVNDEVQNESLLDSFFNNIGELQIFFEEVYDSVSQSAVEQKQFADSLISDSVKWFSNAFSNTETSDKNKFANSISAEIVEAVKVAKMYISLSDDNWNLLGFDETDVIKVWKAKKCLSSAPGADDWPVIKSTCIVDAPPNTIADMLMDSSKVHLTNKYSAGRIDAEKINGMSKICWNKIKLPFSLRPFDFCTLMHVYKSPGGQVMIISKGVEHPTVPKHKDYARSDIIFGVNVLTPLKSNPKRTELTSISHVRYAGIHPYLASANCLSGTTNYLRQLRDVVLSASTK